ncbi:hypothetical protein Q3G72_003851 [Acer saccharum]|nr:hypothetical protein Q3G72_003851 [Acer saccharum]
MPDMVVPAMKCYFRVDTGRDLERDLDGHDLTWHKRKIVTRKDSSCQVLCPSRGFRVAQGRIRGSSVGGEQRSQIYKFRRVLYTQGDLQAIWYLIFKRVYGYDGWLVSALRWTLEG